MRKTTPILALAALLCALAGCPATTPTTPSDSGERDATPDIQADTVAADGLIADTVVDATEDATEDATAVDAIGDTAGPDTSTVDVPTADVATVPTGPIGDPRPAAVTLPYDYTADQAWPLIILLHGYGVTGLIQDAYLGVSKQTTPLGFIAVVPEGTKNSDNKQFWNAMPACCDFGFSGVDDEAYLLGLIDEAKTLWNIDPKRVYFMGHSNGGFMSYRMACHAAGVVAGIVSLAGSSYLNETLCNPSRAVSVLHIHGTIDQTIGFAGNQYFPGAETTVSRWADQNACTSTTDGGTADYESAVVGEETDITWHANCDGGTEVGLWKMNDVGHIPAFTPAFIVGALTWLLSAPPSL